ncbi:LysR family transcriptional regulator [Humibacillus sp. DSM 29435]|uniref:LysR substrate-binding domain-containing protein n=1 Tax=Humibacillus sp. DSM 29435 TaxID=1869167 RepID=UPI0008721832|nr:LysR substrate-binding domain-containing protein [Humibacillus sp. DSM 29435]OFE17580.1 LysR family transcriptional regulator [Humibacillus sp. DSM 29435]
MPEPFRVQFVAGVTPDKWLRIWAARVPDVPLEAAPAGEDPVGELRNGGCSMSFVRLPVDREGLHLIPLYEEGPVVVVAKDHPVAAFDEIDVRDLADEQLLQPSSTVPEWLAVTSPERAVRADSLPPMSTKAAVSVVAAGSGVMIVPLSVARLHHRKDVVHRPVTGIAPSRIGLAWRVDDDDERIETFIGIVRGRTERSSRGESGPARSAPGPAAAPSTASALGADARRSSRPSRRGGAPKPGSAQRRRKRR